MNLVVKNENKFPEGTKLKVYVGHTFKSGDKVYIYYYNKSNKKLELVKSNIEVENGYIEFDVDKGTEYYITKIKLDDEKQEEKNNLLIPSLVFLGFSVVVFLGAIVIFKKKNSKIQKNVQKTDDEII